MSHARNFQDLTGRKFHRLTFLEFVDKNENRNAIWKVRCECGTEFNVVAASVKNGNTKSCGCLKVERCKKGVNRKK